MRRDAVLLVAALVALAGSLFAAWGTAEQRGFDLRGYANPATDADLPYTLPRLGVNADLTIYDADDLPHQLDLMRAAGVTWVRQVFDWADVEAEAGVTDYAKYDAIVAAFADRDDLRLVAVLMGAPDWARVTPQPQLEDEQESDPAAAIDVEVFSRFAQAFARRYGDVIDVYQVWDEPNLRSAWGRAPRSEAYAALLYSAYSAIHSADDGAMVLAAALAPTTEIGPDNISDLLFLDDLYRLGVADFSDGIAAKPYGFDAPPDDGIVRSDVLNFSRAIALREIMVRYGDGRTPLWASEFGWNHLSPDWTGAPSIWGQVSEQQRVAYTQTALDRASRAYPWLGGMILANWQPNAPDDDPRWGFALIDAQGQPTPLYEALVAHGTENAVPLLPTDVHGNVAVTNDAGAEGIRLRELLYDPLTESAPIGLYNPVNSYVRYSGVWTFGALGADIGWINDSQLDFQFEGDAISLMAREDDYVAYLYVSIDGQPANALPRDAEGRAYVILTSDTREPVTRLISLARGLGGGAHTLHIVTDRGWDRWALAGFAVGSADPAEPYNRQIALALLSASVAGLAALLFARRIEWRAARRVLAATAAWLGDAGQIALGGVASVLLMIGMLMTWHDAAPSFFRREPIQLGIAIASAGLLYVNPALPLVVIAALVLLLLFYQRPLLGLTLTLFYAPFFLFPVELLRFAFPMSEVLILITAAAWLLRTSVDWARKRSARYSLLGARFKVRGDGNSERSTQSSALKLQLSTLDYLLIAYLALGIVSLAWTTYRDVALTEVRTLFVEPCLFYLILRTSRPTRVDLLRLVDALVISGVIVAAIGLWQYATGVGIVTAEENIGRLASVYGSPNNASLWLGRCLPFALALALAPLDRRRRIFGGAALVLLIPALVLTQSAGALFFGAPAAIAVVLIAIYGRRALLPLAGLAALAAAAVPFLLRSARFARLLDPTEGTNFFRLRVWQSAIAMLRDHPLLGLGQDQFLYFFRGQYIFPDAWQEPNLSHPHNVALDVWLRLGVAGVVVFAALFVMIARRLIAVLRKTSPAKMDEARLTPTAAHRALIRALAIGALGCLANLLAHGAIDNSIFVNDLVYVFVLICGIAAFGEQLSAARGE